MLTLGMARQLLMKLGYALSGVELDPALERRALRALWRIAGRPPRAGWCCVVFSQHAPRDDESVWVIRVQRGDVGTLYTTVHQARGGLFYPVGPIRKTRREARQDKSQYVKRLNLPGGDYRRASCYEQEAP